MASRSSSGGKPANEVKVEPESATKPRSSRTTKAQVSAAVEQSAEYLAQQAEPPTDVHPKPTTPTQSEVESAVQQSAQFVQEQSDGADVAPTLTRDKAMDATPVSGAVASGSAAAQPVDASRDKLMDAAPVFVGPTTDKAKE